MVIILVLGGVFAFALLLVLVVFARQQNEKKRIEELRRIRLLGDRARQIQLLLEELPTTYISQDFRIFLATQWVELLHEIQNSSGKDVRLNKELEAAQDKLNYLRSSNQPPHKPVTDIQLANAVRRNLKLLNKLIVAMYQDRKISHRIAQTYLNEIKQAFTQTMVEVFQAGAHRAEFEGNLRLAVVHYKRIMSELNRNNPNGINNQTLLESRQMIQKLEEQIALSSETSDNQLADSVSEMIDEADSWKKKQIYDD